MDDDDDAFLYGVNAVEAAGSVAAQTAVPAAPSASAVEKSLNPPPETDGAMTLLNKPTVVDVGAASGHEESDSEEDADSSEDEDIEIIMDPTASRYDSARPIIAAPTQGKASALKEGSAQPVSQLGTTITQKGSPPPLKADYPALVIEEDQALLPDGRNVLDVDLDIYKDQPWRRPGTNLSDYFNYDFDELGWKLYCIRQKTLREANTRERENRMEMAREAAKMGMDIPPEVQAMMAAGMMMPTTASMMGMDGMAQNGMDGMMPQMSNTGMSDMNMMANMEEMMKMQQFMQQMQNMPGFNPEVMASMMMSGAPLQTQDVGDAMVGTNSNLLPGQQSAVDQQNSQTLPAGTETLAHNMAGAIDESILPKRPLSRQGTDSAITEATEQSAILPDATAVASTGGPARAPLPNVQHFPQQPLPPQPLFLGRGRGRGRAFRGALGPMLRGRGRGAFGPGGNMPQAQGGPVENGSGNLNQSFLNAKGNANLQPLGGPDRLASTENGRQSKEQSDFQPRLGGSNSIPLATRHIPASMPQTVQERLSPTRESSLEARDQDESFPRTRDSGRHPLERQESLARSFHTSSRRSRRVSQSRSPSLHARSRSASPDRGYREESSSSRSRRDREAPGERSRQRYREHRARNRIEEEDESIGASAGYTAPTTGRRSGGNDRYDRDHRDTFDEESRDRRRKRRRQRSITPR